MSVRPIVGVVADRKRVTSGPWSDVPFDGLPHAAARAVVAGGGVPFLLPALSELMGEAERFLERVDALFLPGGRDLDASLYGERAHPANDPPLRVRDELEILLVGSAVARGLPVLGACRGMQVLNVALGGGLEQHLADRVDPTPHRDRVGTYTGHAVTIAPGSRLAQSVGGVALRIASHHHQAVDRLGEGLRPVAWAEDGVVEGIEADGPGFLIGVQWHPEERLDAGGLGLFRAFVAAAAERCSAQH